MYPLFSEFFIRLALLIVRLPRDLRLASVSGLIYIDTGTLIGLYGVETEVLAYI